MVLLDRWSSKSKDEQLHQHDKLDVIIYPYFYPDAALANL